jgi:hypothetical protein
MPDTATIQISVTNAKTGQVTLHETFHLAADLTGALIEQLEALVAELPPKRVRVSRRQENGTTLIDLEVRPGGGQPRSRSTDPSFEKLYRRKIPTEARREPI